MGEVFENGNSFASLEDDVHESDPLAISVTDAIQRFAKCEITCSGQLLLTGDDLQRTNDVKGNKLIPRNHVLRPFFCSGVQRFHE